MMARRSWLQGRPYDPESESEDDRNTSEESSEESSAESEEAHVEDQEQNEQSDESSPEDPQANDNDYEHNQEAGETITLLSQVARWDNREFAIILARRRELEDRVTHLEIRIAEGRLSISTVLSLTRRTMQRLERYIERRRTRRSWRTRMPGSPASINSATRRFLAPLRHVARMDSVELSILLERRQQLQDRVAYLERRLPRSGFRLTTGLSLTGKTTRWLERYIGWLQLLGRSQETILEMAYEQGGSSGPGPRGDLQLRQLTSLFPSGVAAAAVRFRLTTGLSLTGKRSETIV
uniref:DUF4780 domain-containing protein n=1 Tax=Steinernema glaseri TaxID=37863 RepID=A0A1I7ZP57_9BILA